MSLTDLAIDETGDLLLGQHPDGEIDLVVWTGAETVAQTVGLKLRVRKGSIWYNRAAGIDHLMLFLSQTFATFRESLIPIAREAYRREILSVDGVQSFEKDRINGALVEQDITFEINDEERFIRPIIPCILIDCDNSINRGFIENVPKVGV